MRNEGKRKGAEKNEAKKGESRDEEDKRNKNIRRGRRW